ncbi:phage tail tube protein [Thermomonospora cellulosilytica]|uniref:Putative secreted protein n=1 Tax=Thermomonospora cellulosilytica TaxID=1411118 RepID=A0A7W3R715_9ACTN|nr:phage tail tube protein [Thermomonospora cellulosilytica]MBA9002009.1 putative secreted protein [Thermomonospora cellulosilytica]
MAGINAFGTELQRSDMAPTPVFTALANVTSIEGPGLSRETIDVTAHDSPDAWMEFRGGLKDGGELSLEVNYDPAEHDVLVADLDDDEPRDYRLVFPDPAATTWTLKLILTEFQPEAPVDDKLAASLTFKVSGKPVLA